MKDKRVIILEDNDDIREIVSIILSGAGYKTEKCSTVKDFWQVIASRLPDICIAKYNYTDLRPCLCGSHRYAGNYFFSKLVYETDIDNLLPVKLCGGSTDLSPRISG